MCVVFLFSGWQDTFLISSGHVALKELLMILQRRQTLMKNNVLYYISTLHFSSSFRLFVIFSWKVSLLVLSSKVYPIFIIPFNSAWWIIHGILGVVVGKTQTYTLLGLFLSEKARSIQKTLFTGDLWEENGFT